MAERKVLNKYFPPDFDPTRLAKKKAWKDMKVIVRMMLPMNVQCETCGEFMYAGTKFNTRKEDVEGEDYLGIRIYRFYFRCLGCSATFAVKTDPKNSDYACEFGVHRNFEPWRAQLSADEEAKAKREAEEKGDAMKALENRTEESKRELDLLDALEEMRDQNDRIASADIDTVMRARSAYHDKKEAEISAEQKDEIEAAFVKRVHLIKDDELEPTASTTSLLGSIKPLESTSSSSSSAPISSAKTPKPTVPIENAPKFTLVKKTIEKKRKKKKKKKKSKNANEPSGLASLLDYD
eukprot:85939_1